MASSVQNNKVPTPLTVACPVMPTLPGSNETLRTQTCLPQSGLPVCFSPKTSVSTVRPSGIRSRLQGLCRGEQWVPSNPSSAAFARHDESGRRGAAAPTEGAGRLKKVRGRWRSLTVDWSFSGGGAPRGKHGRGMWDVDSDPSAERPAADDKFNWGATACGRTGASQRGKARYTRTGDNRSDPFLPWLVIPNFPKSEILCLIVNSTCI